MSADVLLDASGPAAPPRQNGELVFAAPWERELFGITMALHEAGLFAWDELRALLISEIRAWETGDRAEPWSYYRLWARALERLVEARGIVSGGEIATRMASLAQRPVGHDHRH